MKHLTPLRTPLFCILAGAMMLFTAHAQNAGVKPTVTGKFLGDGKDGKIQYLLAQTTEPFSDKPAIKLIFTERDPAASKKPAWDAGFKKLGSALIISTHKDGGVFGCEVAHSAHEKSPFSSVGRIKINDLKVTDTHISGLLTTEGEGEFFGQTWDVELTFSAPLPKGAFAEVSEPEPKAMSEKESEASAAAAGPKMPVSKLPLPAGALEVDYQSAVEHISFRSTSPVSIVAKDFAAKLKTQGWKDAPGSLMGKSNAIIRRKLDAAELTIMVQPAGSGCTVKVLTQGLDWSEAPTTTAAKPAAGDASGIEAEANRLIKEALKGIPKF